MAAQLSLKAALPLVKRPVKAPGHSSNTGPSNVECISLMMTSSNGNIFRVTGPLCGEFTVTGEFTAQRPVTQSFDVFFDLRLNKELSKQPCGWWFETPSRPLWRHRQLGRAGRGIGGYSPWAKTQIFTYRYHLGGQNLVMFFMYAYAQCII